MYKKLLLASAIASIATAAGAGTLDSTGFTQPAHGKEGARNVADADGLGAGSVLLRLGGEYAANDTITFTFNNAKATNSNWPTSLTSITPGSRTTTTLAASCAKGATVCNFATNQNIVDGDLFTVPGDTTLHRVMNRGTANATVFTPALVATEAQAAVISLQNPKTMSLGLVNSDDNSATYRVLSTGGAGSPTSTVGTLIPTPMININTTQAVAAATTLSVASATSTGVAMDTTAGTATVMSTVQEHTVTASTKFNQVVDVEASSKAFVGSGAATGTDTLVLTYAAGTTAAGSTVTVNGSGVITTNAATTAIASSASSSVMTVNGDFAFMDDNTATAGCQSTSGLASSTGSSTAALNTNCTEFTMTDTTMATTTLTLTKDQAAAVIPTQTYTGSQKISYTSNATAASDTNAYSDLGSWTLNGASITVYGVPMGATVDRMLWVNNKGASDVAVTAAVTSGGTTTSNLSLGTAAALSNTSVDEALDTALAAAGVTLPANSRANVVISAPAKAADITVSASYKVIADADRLSLETSDTIDDVVSVTGSGGAISAAFVAGTNVTAGTLKSISQTATSVTTTTTSK